MEKIKAITTNLQDVLILEPQIFFDNRGFFIESYSKRDFAEIGIDIDFIQDNYSFSKDAYVLRGLHFQTSKQSQTKLIRIITGVVLDVIVDLRNGSPTYGKHQTFILSEYNKRMLLVPQGFAHGFVTLTNNVNFMYKCDNYYDHKSEAGIHYNDTYLNIDWQCNLQNITISEKDKNLQSFQDFAQQNLFTYKKLNS